MTNCATEHVMLSPSAVAEVDAERAWTTPEDLSVGTWERLEPYLPRLEPIEADMLMMVHWGMRQEQIARYFGMVQCGVSYRISRARQKIQILRTLPGERRLRALADWAKREGLRGAETLAAYLRTWSQTRAAEETGTTQRAARDVVIACLEEAARRSPHRRTARRVLEAMRSKRAMRCSGARTFVAKTEPLMVLTADPSPRVLADFVRDVEEWEARNG